MNQCEHGCNGCENCIYYETEHMTQETECSATYGMTIAQRILHIGGRENAQTYIEFGSVAAVRALVAQVLRDMPNGCPDFPATPAPTPPNAQTTT